MRRIITTVTTVLAALAVVSPAAAHEEGTWIIRAGVGTVAPDDNNLDLGALGILEVDDGTSLTLTFTHMLTQNWAFDILAAWPFGHDIKLGSDKVASTDHLPPTFSMQYHFSPDAAFQPYVGAGLNYTTFFSTDTTGPLDGTDLDLDDSFGLALQLGADFKIDEEWLINLDVRYIDIETEAKLDGTSLGDVAIDPWVYAINVGRRF